jgi:hypothetical protein
MGTNKIEFFIIRTFDDLVFTQDYPRKHEHPEIIEMLGKITPFRSRIKFEKEFGGDGTEASVVYGASTYSTKGKDGKYDTFEVMYSDDDEPRGYETKEQINEEFLRRSFNRNSI